MFGRLFANLLLCLIVDSLIGVIESISWSSSNRLILSEFEALEHRLLSFAVVVEGVVVDVDKDAAERVSFVDEANDDEVADKHSPPSEAEAAAPAELADI